MDNQATEAEIQSRFDLTVLRAYGSSQNVWATRDQILRTWRKDEALSKLALSTQEGFSALSDEDDQRAVANIADYFFEPMVMPTMNVGQARDYYLSIQNSMRIDMELDGLYPDKPIIIEAVHHCCVYSVLFVIFQHLVRDLGFKRVVVLHQQEQLFPRLELWRSLAHHALGVEFIPVRVDEPWQEPLAEAVTNNSIILYMGDMPAKAFPKLRRPERALSRVQLFAEPNIDVEARAISMAHLIARRFKGRHFSLDFPERDVARFKPRAGNAPLSCPLPDWAFWPLLQHWYRDSSIVPQRAV